MFTCHCLNVALDADFSPELECLEASEEPFETSTGDQWKLGVVREVTRAHPSLTRHVQMGRWRAERCLNCGQYTHATTPTRPGRCWLNAKLLDERAVNDLKSSDLVSAIFHVVINPNGIGADARPPPIDGWYGNVADAVNDLNGTVAAHVSKEQARIEAEIRQFSERQYERLNNIKEKAMKERETLMRNAIKVSLDLAPPTPEAPPPARARPNRDDVMFMFPYEEFDRAQPEMDEDDDDDDYVCDEAEDLVKEGVAIPRKGGESGCGVAKSCPVDIPNYVARVSTFEEAEGEAAQFDIAANIRALAKSVHGDAIFGELPRPKFSTQI